MDIWIDRQTCRWRVNDLFNQSEICELALVQFGCCSFKTGPGLFFLFFLAASYKELFKPRHRHTEQAFIPGQRDEGAGERASLWKLGNSRILVLNRRPPFLITEVRRLAFPTLSSLLLVAALTLRFDYFFSSESCRRIPTQIYRCNLTSNNRSFCRDNY